MNYKIKIFIYLTQVLLKYDISLYSGFQWPSINFLFLHFPVISNGTLFISLFLDIIYNCALNVPFTIFYFVIDYM